MDRPWGHKELDMTEQITLKNSFPGSSVVKNLLANAGDTDSIPGPGRSPGEGNGNPLQYSCLGNSGTEEPSRLQPMGCRIDVT